MLLLSITLNIMLFSIMLGMGATLDFVSFQDTFKSCKPFLVGMMSQFIILPFLGYVLIIGLSLSPAIGLGLLLLACTPGGSTSNLYTYYAKGDLALSISMTVASSVVAVIVMPLLLRFYAGILGIEGEITIPYAKIIFMLVLLLLPVSIGMIIKKKMPAIAKKVEKVSALIGFLAILVIFMIPIINNREMFTSSWNTILGAALIAPSGMLFGYGASRLLRLSVSQSKTISLETGIQNAVLTIGIITLSFNGTLLKELLFIPILYTFFIPIFSVIVTFYLFRRIA